MVVEVKLFLFLNGVPKCLNFPRIVRRLRSLIIDKSDTKFNMHLKHYSEFVAFPFYNLYFCYIPDALLSKIKCSFLDFCFIKIAFSILVTDHRSYLIRCSKVF